VSRVVAVCLLLVGAVVPGIAHHSVANLDMNRTVTIEGTVDKLEWTNPHMWLWVSVTGAAGVVQHWGIEGASPANMNRRAGWTKRSVAPGEKVKVDVHPFRDGRPGGTIVRVLKADGQVLGSGGGGPTPGALPGAPAT
jgi:hypothetical protein